MVEGIAHGFGVSAFALAGVGFQIRGRRRLLLTNVAVSALLATQFLLLGALHGAVGAAATGTCSAVAASLRHDVIAPWRRYVVPSAALIAVVGVAAWTTGLSSVTAWLPALAFAAGRLAELSRQDQQVRLLLLPVSTTWLIYGWAQDAWASVALEATMVATNAWGIYRLFLRRPTGQPG